MSASHAQSLPGREATPPPPPESSSLRSLSSSAPRIPTIAKSGTLESRPNLAQTPTFDGLRHNSTELTISAVSPSPRRNSTQFDTSTYCRDSPCHPPSRDSQ